MWYAICWLWSRLLLLCRQESRRKLAIEGIQQTVACYITLIEDYLSFFSRKLTGQFFIRFCGYLTKGYYMRWAPLYEWPDAQMLAALRNAYLSTRTTKKILLLLNIILRFDCCNMVNMSYCRSGLDRHNTFNNGTHSIVPIC